MMLGFVPQPNLRTASLMAEFELVDELNIHGNTFPIRHDSFDARNFHSQKISSSILEVNSNTHSMVETGTTQISPSQININQFNSFQVSSEVSSPEIATDEATSVKISSEQISIPETDIAKISSGHIDTTQINSRKIGIMNDDILEVPSFVDMFAQLLNISNLSNGVIPDNAIRHDSGSKNNTFVDFDISQISIPQIATNQLSSFTTSQVSTSQISTSHINVDKSSTPPPGFLQIGIAQIGVDQEVGQITKPQIGTTKVSIDKVSTSNTGILQISSAEIGAQKAGIANTDISQVSTSKVSLPSFVTLNNFFTQGVQPEHFLKFIHTKSSTSTNTYNSNPYSPWETFANNLTLEITDLPTGQLAEAQITSYNSQGIPNGGTILIDRNANEVGWFIDPTPLDHSEFSHTLADTALLAAADSEAYGKYDLITAILHEMGHLAGFISGYTEFDRHIQQTKGNKTVSPQNFGVGIIEASMSNQKDWKKISSE